MSSVGQCLPNCRRKVPVGCHLGQRASPSRSSNWEHIERRALNRFWSLAWNREAESIPLAQNGSVYLPDTLLFSTRYTMQSEPCTVSGCMEPSCPTINIEFLAMNAQKAATKRIFFVLSHLLWLSCWLNNRWLVCSCMTIVNSVRTLLGRRAGSMCLLNTAV